MNIIQSGLNDPLTTHLINLEAIIPDLVVPNYHAHCYYGGRSSFMYAEILGVYLVQVLIANKSAHLFICETERYSKVIIFYNKKVASLFIKTVLIGNGLYTSNPVLKGSSYDLENAS